MNKIGTQPLYTKRLVLRRFTINDASDMFTHWASDEDVVTFLTWPAYHRIEDVKAKLQEWVLQYENPLQFMWAITLNGTVIGNISTVRINEQTNACEIGYVLSKQYWGHNYMTESLQAVIDYLFDKGDFNRIAATHDPNNPASGRVMQKAGMTYEGTLRQSACNNQGIVDTSYYSILKMEWLTRHSVRD